MDMDYNWDILLENLLGYIQKNLLGYGWTWKWMDMYHPQNDCNKKGQLSGPIQYIVI